MGPAKPPAVNECAQQIIPSLILLFDGLKRAYAAKASDAGDEENEEDDSDIDEGSNFHLSSYISFHSFLFSKTNSAINMFIQRFYHPMKTKLTMLVKNIWKSCRKR